MYAGIVLSVRRRLIICVAKLYTQSRGRNSFSIDIFTIELYYPLLFIQFLLLSLRSIRQFSFFFSVHFYTTYNLSLSFYKSVLDNDIKEQFILCPRWKNEIILSTVGVFLFSLTMAKSKAKIFERGGGNSNF